MKSCMASVVTIDFQDTEEMGNSSIKNSFCICTEESNEAWNIIMTEKK